MWIALGFGGEGEVESPWSSLTLWRQTGVRGFFSKKRGSSGELLEAAAHTFCDGKIVYAEYC